VGGSLRPFHFFADGVRFTFLRAPPLLDVQFVVPTESIASLAAQNDGFSGLQPLEYVHINLNLIARAVCLEHATSCPPWTLVRGLTHGVIHESL